MWYASSPYNQWAISVTVGSGIGTWVTSKTTTSGCPDGTYSVESGTIIVGSC